MVGIQLKEIQLKGSIIGKEEIRNYQGHLKGQSYYELKVNLTPKTKPAVFGGTIQAIREKILDDNTWNDILTDNYANKNYYFYCYKRGYTYKLVRWVEIENKEPKKNINESKNNL